MFRLRSGGSRELNGFEQGASADPGGENTPTDIRRQRRGDPESGEQDSRGVAGEIGASAFLLDTRHRQFSKTVLPNLPSQ